MINTELLKPANFITIGLVSILFTLLVDIAHKQINGDAKNGE